MKHFQCKYCKRDMAVTFLEYRSNSFCNLCFDERAASKPIAKSRLNTFEFMGETIGLCKESINTNRPQKKHS